jgi:hypothetical protein
MELDLRGVQRTNIGGYAISRICVPIDDLPLQAEMVIGGPFRGITVSFQPGISMPITDMSYMNPDTGQWERIEGIL